MKKHGNKMIASVGYYLTDSNGRRGFALPVSDEPLKEKRIPKEAEVINNTAIIGGVFAVNVSDHIKRDLITSIWSNDDQIAIILNREENEDGKELYDLMQGWRSWFGEIAHIIAEL